MMLSLGGRIEAARHSRFVKRASEHELFPAQTIFQFLATVLTVLAGRNPPAIEWRADPGWHSFARIVQLRNLAFEERQSYLQKRQVPTEQHHPILDFTHGHPLALSLLADTFAQSIAPRWKLVRLVTEPLLVEMIDDPNPIFAWS